MTTANRIIKNEDGSLNVPDTPTVPFIEGDGIGRDIWPATRMVLDSAVHKAYGGQKKISWFEVPAGEKGFQETGSWLPGKTLDQINNQADTLKMLREAMGLDTVVSPHAMGAYQGQAQNLDEAINAL